MISVIIPVYNRQASAIRALQSASAQQVERGQTLEIILVDDASDPPLDVGSLANTRVIRLDRNAGPAAARNRGIGSSQGEWIAFLDSDDLWRPDKLARQMALVSGWPADADKAKLGVACGFYHPNRSSRRLEYRLPATAASVLEFASGCWIAPGSTLLLHRTAFDATGLFDERLRRLEDYDWLLRFGMAGGRIEVADYPGAIIAPSGLANSQIVAECVRLLDAKYGAGKEIELRRPAWSRFAAYLALERGVADFGSGRPASGLQHVVHSLLLSPRWRPRLLSYGIRRADIPQAVSDLYGELVRINEDVRNPQPRRP